MTVGQDVRFGMRQMARRPGFAVIAVVVLAVGIGSVSAVFAVLYQALLKPLPYPNSQQLFFIHNAFPKSQVAMAGVSGFDYGEIRKHTDIFARCGIYYYNDLNLTGVGTTQHVDVVNASASMFDVFGVKPEMGRLFTAAEDAKGADGTAILSDGLWRSMFGADRKVLGRVIHLNGLPYTVVGVMPRSFQFPSAETQLWVPVAMRAGEFTIEGGRMEKWLHMVARLAPGVSAERASAALNLITDDFAAHYSAFYPKTDGWHFTSQPLADELTEHIRRWLYLAFGAVGAVMLIAGINVSGLLLIRGTARQNEISIRLAVGATKLRIVRQLLTETALLALGGCLLGMIAAVAAIRFINVYGPLRQPTPVWTWALLSAPLMALLGTCIAGLVPAFGAIRLRARGTTKWRDFVVAGQIALALTLLFTAVQLSRSFLNLTHQPPGFQAERLWTGAIDLPSQRYKAPQSWNTNFFTPLMEELGSLPGVQIASGGHIPFNPSGFWTEALNLPGRAKQSPPPEAQIGLNFPGYFETMQIPLVRGRTFTKQDRDGAPPVAVIDEELARRYFPDEDPIGKLIGSGGGDHPATIIGLVGSVQNSDLGGPREPEVYFPALQERTEETYLVLRLKSDVDPTSAVRRIVAKLDPGAALYDVQFMQQRLARSLELRSFIALLLNALALIGLLLAVVGLYGSLAHLVELRQREIGIRAALGAGLPQIAGLIFGRCALVIGLGIAAGAFGAVFAGRAVEHQLFGVDTSDAIAWVAVLAVMIVIGGVSAYLPAARAVRIDPAVALRHE